jgi:transcriptional regulator of acetoin/glycerol metabolism
VLICEDDVLLPHHLPQRLLSDTTNGSSGDARYSFFGSRTAERDRIIAALQKHRGNRTRAARALGMARNTLRARISALRIDDSADRDARPGNGRVEL